jgi:hypothetical protein
MKRGNVAREDDETLTLMLVGVMRAVRAGLVLFPRELATFA